MTDWLRYFVQLFYSDAGLVAQLVISTSIGAWLFANGRNLLLSLLAIVNVAAILNSIALFINGGVLPIGDGRGPSLFFWASIILFSFGGYFLWGTAAPIHRGALKKPSIFLTQIVQIGTIALLLAIMIIGTANASQAQHGDIYMTMRSWGVWA